MNTKRLMIFSIVLIHYFIFISFVLTCIGSFIVLEWYIAATLLALVVRVIFSNDECPLTTLENYYRTKYNLKKSLSFLKDYVMSPVTTIKYILQETTQ